MSENYDPGPGVVPDSLYSTVLLVSYKCAPLSPDPSHLLTRSHSHKEIWGYKSL